MGKKLAYFIDYNEDGIVPLGASPMLVKKYEKLMERAGTELLGRFDTKAEMMSFAVEFDGSSTESLWRFRMG